MCRSIFILLLSFQKDPGDKSWWWGALQWDIWTVDRVTVTLCWAALLLPCDSLGKWSSRFILRRSDAGSWFRDQGEHASVIRKTESPSATFQQKVGEKFLSWLKNKSLHKLQLKVFNVFSNYSILNDSFSCKLSLFRKCHIATLFCFGNIQRA